MCTLAFDTSTRSDRRQLFFVLFNSRHFKCWLFFQLPIHQQPSIAIKSPRLDQVMLSSLKLPFVRFDDRMLLIPFAVPPFGCCHKSPWLHSHFTGNVLASSGSVQFCFQLHFLGDLCVIIGVSSMAPPFD